MKIKRTKDLCELSIKRFYLPFIVSDECGKCRGDVLALESDPEQDAYISEPVMGSSDTTLFFRCGR